MMLRHIDAAFDAGMARLRAGESWLLDGRRAAYGASALRILVGLTALGFLVANWLNRHYLWGDASAWLDPMRNNGGFGWPFTWFVDSVSPTMLTVKMLVVAALLVLLVVGWRTRVIVPLVLVTWVSLIEANPVYGDQSDNIVRILLIYLCFADASGRWSLDARRRQRKSLPNTSVGTLLHNLAVIAVGAQICIIYLASGLYKVQGELWQEGTAVYYPLQVGQYRPWPELSDLLTANAFGVLLATYVSVLIQIFFPIMLIRRSTRVLALAGTGVMHLSIAVLMGLPFFSLFVFAGDLVFIRDRSYRRAETWLRERIPRRPVQEPESPVPTDPERTPVGV